MTSMHCNQIRQSNSGKRFEFCLEERAGVLFFSFSFRSVGRTRKKEVWSLSGCEPDHRDPTGMKVRLKKRKRRRLFVCSSPNASTLQQAFRLPGCSGRSMFCFSCSFFKGWLPLFFGGCLMKKLKLKKVGRISVISTSLINGWDRSRFSQPNITLIVIVIVIYMYACVLCSSFSAEMSNLPFSRSSDRPTLH